MMFGAIGYTWEHDLHLYWRKATSLAASIGPTGAFAEALGELTRTEVGKKLDEGTGEVEFSASIFEFYAEPAEALLADP
ncbi:hypothetical protein DKX15_19725, partial [Enterococcus faecium]